jgi:membrane protein
MMPRGSRDEVELGVAGAEALASSSGPEHGERAGRRRSLHRRSATGLRRFWRVMMDANVTGSSAMVAYNMLLGVIPVALLALFVGGQVLPSPSVQQSVLHDLRGIFPGADVHTLDSLLDQIQSSTTSTGVLALLASLWLGSSFWGALDTAFARIYRCKSRPWLEQKRFALGMLIVVLVVMIATVAVPTVQSIIKAGRT